MEDRARWSLGRRLVAGFGALLLVGWLLSAAAVAWYASHDRAAPADAIVVLGAAQYLGRPSPVLRTRLDHARTLHARGLAPRIVLTGGTAEGDTTSEAAVARVYLMARGVPDSLLLLEENGRTSQQSLRAVGELLRARDLKRVIVVSDPFHVFRASLLARGQGLKAFTSPTRSDGLWQRITRQPDYFLGESVKAPLALVMR